MGFFSSKNNESTSYEKLKRKNDALESALEKQKMNLNLSKSNNTGLQQNLAEYKTKVKKLEKGILRLIQGLIPAEYIQTRKIHPDIDHWGTDQLIDFTIDTVKNKHNSLVREKTDLKKQLRVLKEEKVQLKNKLDGYLNNKKEILNQEEDVETETEIVSGVEKEVFDEPEMQPPPKKDNDSEQKNEKFKSIKKAVENKMKNKESNEKKNNEENNQDKDLRNIAENMDAGHWALLEAIGKYGIYRNKELEKNSDIQKILETNYSFNNHLSFLISENVIEIKEEDLFIGVRGHSYNTFVLTENGKKLFKSKFNMKAKPSMRDWLINEHTNLKHGILIHDTAIVFENYGYDVFMDRETNTIQVSNETEGERVVFDLTIKQGPIVKHIEVERGNHKQSDFEKKLQKISDVTSSFYFVVHNNKTKDNIKAKYSKWIAKMKDKQKRQQYQFNIITLEELKKDENNWEIIKLNR
jgi:FtsZ-binding cell division protein ZapB